VAARPHVRCGATTQGTDGRSSMTTRGTGARDGTRRTVKPGAMTHCVQGRTPRTAGPSALRLVLTSSEGPKRSTWRSLRVIQVAVTSRKNGARRS
jgi:hypothetical protein